jgi:uncharacterized protein
VRPANRGAEAGVERRAGETRPLVLSRFAHLLERDGAACLVHALTLRKVYGGSILRDIRDAFRKPTRVKSALPVLARTHPGVCLEPILSDILDKGLLLADPEDDRRVYQHLFYKGLDLYAIRHMYFLPTSACNFRCRYCFVEDEARCLEPMFMSRRVAEQGIDVFSRLTRGADPISITFYGGEPLMNADVVYHTLRYVRSLEADGTFQKPVRLSLLTNGALVDDATVAALRETKTSVSVSLDGPEHLHDAARTDGANRGTFRAALAGYRKLQEAGLKPGVSCTLGPANVHEVEEIVAFIARELRPAGMGFNILLPTINGDSVRSYPYEFAAQQLVKAFRMLRELGIYEDRVMRRVRPYVNGGFHLKDCMGVGGQIVIGPDGSIGPCQACLGLDRYFPLKVEDLHSRLSSLSSEDVYSHPLFDEWRHRFPLNMKACIECPAIAVCGGGCPYASEVTSGSIWELDERVCHQAKTIFEWMLWDTYDRFAPAEGAGSSSTSNGS